MSYWMFLLGVFIGSLISTVLFHIRTARGVLKIDRFNNDKDIYRLEINNLDELDKKSKVLLKIEHDADLSQR